MTVRKDRLKEYEQKMVEIIDEIFDNIITTQPFLNIRAKSRAGSEISEYLETEFLEYVHANNPVLVSEPEKSPKGATKHPFDARFVFDYQNRKEEVWIDIKAFKVSSADSNPDIGTINKVIRFIEEGNYYIVFVLVFYEESGEGLRFVKKNDKYVKVYPLKDVSRTVRLNPKHQLQINVSAEPEYRTRTEFIELLKRKHQECLIRMIEKSQKELEQLDAVYENLQSQNLKSESSNNN